MRYALYKWIITKDHSPRPGAEPGCNDNAATLEGPRNCDPALTVKDLPDKFRMYDDDDKLYYEGVCNCLSSSHPDVDGFEPLDDFGTPNAGCSRIDYYEDGRWNTL